jgi:ribosomal protein L37AE/L43A
MGKQQGEECEECGSAAVELTRRETSGAEVWVCSECGDFKRRCPACDEGWVRLLRVPKGAFQVYACEECESSWEEAGEIRASRAEPLHDYLTEARQDGNYLKLKVVRENDRPEKEDDAA